MPRATSGAHLGAKGHLDELQKADIVSKSKLVPSSFIKTHYWKNTGNEFYFRGGRYRQVSLYLILIHFIHRSTALTSRKSTEQMRQRSYTHSGIPIHTLSELCYHWFKPCHKFELSSAQWQPFRSGFSALMQCKCMKITRINQKPIVSCLRLPFYHTIRLGFSLIGQSLRSKVEIVYNGSYTHQIWDGNKTKYSISQNKSSTIFGYFHIIERLIDQL